MKMETKSTMNHSFSSDGEIPLILGVNRMNDDEIRVFIF